MPLSNQPLMGLEVSLLKFSVGYCIKCPDLHKKLIFANPYSMKGGGRGQFTKNSLLGMTQNIMFKRHLYL